MKFVSALTTERDLDEAAADLIAQVELESVDLLTVFFTPDFTPQADQLARRLRDAFDPGLLVGASAESVVGAEEEVERRPAVSLMAAHLPGVGLHPVTFEDVDWRAVLTSPLMLQRIFEPPTDAKLVLLLADPFTTPVDAVLHVLNQTHSGLPVVGGLASGGSGPGENVLLHDDRQLASGAVGVVLTGNLSVDVVVSQGCRPVGSPMIVTAAERNLIGSLNGEQPMMALQNTVAALPAADRQLMQRGLLIGRAIDREQREFGRGDFLIRSVMGIERESGAMAVGDRVTNGEVVQFHLRDADTAAEDLEMMLAPQAFYDDPAGGLLFTCNGRGTRLYDQPNGDIDIIQDMLGGIALAGFFAAGEIGPVGGQNFVHGHTASLVLFRPGNADG